MGPVPEQERILLLDVVRGVAILGILVVNIQLYALPAPAMDMPGYLGPPGFWDLVAFHVTNHVFELKFITLFSILFGASLQLITHRAWQRGVPAEPLLLRRFTVLALIGLVHALGFWYGDILFPYAVGGLLLVVCIRWPAPALVLASIVTCLVPILLFSFVAAALAASGQSEWGGGGPGGGAPGILDEVRVYSSGDLGQIMALRALTWSQIMVMMIFFFPRLLACFWFGMALIKLGILVQPQAHRRFYRLCMTIGYPVGVLVGLSEAAGRMGWGTGGVGELVAFPLQMLGSVALALAYLGTLAWVLDRGWLMGLWRRFAAVGRMALTSYLTHTLVFTTMMYSYGLGLFGSIPRAQLPLLALSLVALQLLLSPWWLQHFQFGPIEWLWRCLTYGRWYPLRRSATGALSGASLLCETAPTGEEERP